MLKFEIVQSFSAGALPERYTEVEGYIYKNKEVTTKANVKYTIFKKGTQDYSRCARVGRFILGSLAVGSSCGFALLSKRVRKLFYKDHKSHRLGISKDNAKKEVAKDAADQVARKAQRALGVAAAKDAADQAVVRRAQRVLGVAAAKDAADQAVVRRAQRVLGVAAAKDAADQAVVRRAQRARGVKAAKGAAKAALERQEKAEREVEELEALLRDIVPQEDRSEKMQKQIEAADGQQETASKTELLHSKLEPEKAALPEEQSDFKAYFYALDAADTLDNDASIVFENGLIRALLPEETQPENTRRILLHLLRSTYGRVLGNRIFFRFGFNTKDVFTLGHLKKAVIGAAAHVNVSDLESLFKWIKLVQPGKNCLPGFMAGNYILKDESLFNGLRSVEQFQDLSSAQMKVLLDAFRTVTINNDPTKDLFKAFYPEQEAKAVMTDKNCLVKHAIEVLDVAEQWNCLDLKHHKLALTERLGKSLPYLELEDGMVFALPDKDNNPCYYKVAKALPYRKDGVRGFLIAPVNPQQNAYGENKENISLIFRGTEANSQKPESGASIGRDMDPLGVGKTTFENREEDILRMVSDYLQSRGEVEVELNISGHSLGGCDTQRALVAVMDRMTKPDVDFHKIKRVVMTAHNAPALDPATNQRYFDAADKLAERSAYAQVEIEINHVRYFDEGYEDFVQKMGDVLVGAPVGQEHNYPFIKRNIIDVTLEINPGRIKGLEPRHSTRVFNNELCKIEWHMNTTKGDELSTDEERKEFDKRLARGYYWDATPNSWQVGALLGWYVGYFGTGAQYATQIPVASLFGNFLSVARSRLLHTPNEDRGW